MTHVTGREGTAGTPAALQELLEAARAELQRTNFAGRTVTLAEGLAVLAAVAGLALRSGGRDASALAGIGALGAADDLLEPRQRAAGRTVSKGLRGHLGGLLSGEVTTGAAKALGIPLLALAACAGRGRGAATVLMDGALVAGSANLVNLLDLRPGRALKVVLPAAGLLAAAGDAAGEARALALAALLPGAAALPVDLRERGMLGDAGANVLGAAVGLAATRALPAAARLALLAGVVSLTLASEKVSFSAVIDRTAALRALDRAGRLPVEGGR